VHRIAGSLMKYWIFNCKIYQSNVEGKTEILIQKTKQLQETWIHKYQDKSIKPISEIILGALEVEAILSQNIIPILMYLL